MSEPERFEVLILGSGQGGKLLAWHMARLGEGRPSWSAVGSEGPVPISPVFTDPPLAHVGLSEGEAQRQGATLGVAKLPMKRVRRTATTDKAQGFMKVLVGGSDDRILGFTMIGAPRLVR